MSFTYYHNPRCSKSRQGLEILKEENLDFTIKEYLKESLTTEELQNIFEKLQKRPSDVVRSKESIYKELDLSSKELSEKEWAETIVNNPVLLERPILVGTSKAVIGRPPEDLKTIL